MFAVMNNRYNRFSGTFKETEIAVFEDVTKANELADELRRSVDTTVEDYYVVEAIV